MEWTGERMVPEATPARTFWEHVHRYRMALSFAPGKRVLDIACGEGYGTRSLQAAGAASVLGIDISTESAAHANRKYGVAALAGDAQRIPLPDASMDVIVSFETVEHVPNPDAFIAECARVLVPGGTLIISTPERRFYSPHGHWNEAHVCEMTEEEFTGKLSKRFEIEEVYAQRHLTAAWWSLRWLSAEKNWCRNLTRWLMQHDQWLRRLTGYWRLRNFIFQLIGEAEPSDRVRDQPQEAILRKSGLLTRLFHPCHPRVRKPSSRETPVYIVVIARRKPV